MRGYRFHRLQALLLAGILAAGVTACGDAAGNDSTTEAAAEETTEAAVSTEDDAEDSTEADTETDENADTASTEEAAEGAAASATEDDAETTEQDVDSTALTGERHRRTLPHKETVEAAEAEAGTEENPNAVEENYPASTEEIVRLKTYKGDTVSYKEISAVAEKTIARKDDSYPDSEEDMEQILNGLMKYWADDDMESVDYLVRMGKYEYLSQMLKGTADYFYVGDENADGEPDGTGLAVYAGNAYYYGAFKDGERSGEGYWYQIFVQDGPYSKANNGIIGHSYRGMWANDLPNGEGQEHLDIDTEYLEDRIITNVRTTFADGYYNGEIIATSLEKDEGMINWTGEARYGTMVVIDGEFVKSKDGRKEVRVLQNVDNENNYYWMLLEENMGQGITGLVD